MVQKKNIKITKIVDNIDDLRLDKGELGIYVSPIGNKATMYFNSGKETGELSAITSTDNVGTLPAGSNVEISGSAVITNTDSDTVVQASSGKNVKLVNSSGDTLLSAKDNGSVEIGKSGKETTVKGDLTVDGDLTVNGSSNIINEDADTRVKASTGNDVVLTSADGDDLVKVSDIGLELGKSGEDTTIKGGLVVADGEDTTLGGNLTVKGNTVLGDASTDTVETKGSLTVDENATIKKDVTIGTDTNNMLTINANISSLKSKSSFAVDIDNDNDSTSESFKITKDNGATELLCIGENANIISNGGIFTVGNNTLGNNSTRTTTINGKAEVTRDVIVGKDGEYSGGINSANHLYLNMGYNKTSTSTYRMHFGVGGLNNTATRLMSLTGNGKLGIGIENPDTPLVINKSGGSSIITAKRSDSNITGSIGAYCFKNLNGQVTASISAKCVGNDDTSDLIFGTSNQNNQTNPYLLPERMRILASGGITFNGDTSTANALDDYEEGTWTPTIYGDGTNVNRISTTHIAKYTKIGNLVFCQMFVEVDGASLSGDSGTLLLGGFPFTPVSGSYAPVNFSRCSFLNKNVSGYLSDNSKVYFYENTNTDTPVGISSVVASTKYCMFSVVYQAA